ncbi:nuclease [Edaphobacter sp. DSM 109919]|uniref:Nuclease n=1 Tax=Edaphobacter paludis TaxID=3035702 RepID=A0AAU7D0R4_9BACT
MKRQLVFLFAVLCGVAQAQQPIGNVAVQDAMVAGDLTVNNGRAVLVANTTVTAKDRTADVTLNRGGSIHVCATSGLHITSGKSATGPAPLMLSLDRGAIEVQMAATTSDVIMTPDLRFGIASNGPLDLRLRVTSNGDTCVENRGANAPILTGADQFGESSYDLRPGQHVLFEHGSLKEVVDNESSPCGCPPAPTAPGISLADAALAAGSPKQSAEAEHPFPAAISNGLAPVPSAPQAPPGVVHAQVATTLTYDANGEATDNTSSASTPGNSTAAVPAPAPPPVVQPRTAEPRHPSDVGHWIGHFFKRLFGRG